jgi:hypothetical protein
MFALLLNVEAFFFLSSFHNCKTFRVSYFDLTLGGLSLSALKQRLLKFFLSLIAKQVLILNISRIISCIVLFSILPIIQVQSYSKMQLLNWVCIFFYIFEISRTNPVFF